MEKDRQKAMLSLVGTSVSVDARAEASKPSIGWLIETDSHKGPCFEFGVGHHGDESGWTTDILYAKRYATVREAQEKMDALTRQFPSRQYTVVPATIALATRSSPRRMLSLQLIATQMVELWGDRVVRIELQLKSGRDYHTTAEKKYIMACVNNLISQREAKQQIEPDQPSESHDSPNN